MSHRHFAGLVVTVVFSGLVAGCERGSSSVRPSPTASVQVVGPDTLQAGQSAQFVVIIRQADGSTKSARSMSGLTWVSSNPSLMSVSDSGMVTAASSGFGEAVITAEIVTSAGLRADAIQGTRKVVLKQKAVVTGKLEVSQGETKPNQVSYVFALTLTESAGVAATVTDLWITFDDGWAGGCSWIPYTLGQTRLPANGTLALDPLTCSLYGKYFDVVVSIVLKDDDGHVTYVELYRVL